MRGIDIKSKRTGVPGWHTEQEETTLVNLVQSLSFPPNEQVTIVELGGEYGRSASEFAWALRDKNYNGHVYTVDTFSDQHPQVGDLLEAYTHNLKECGLIDYCTPIKGTTATQAGKWNKPIDLLFIDAGHTYLAVKSDIAGWVGYVKQGGIVVFHDYAKNNAAHTTHLDVKRAVDEWFNQVQNDWQKVNGPDSLVWFIRKSHVEHGKPKYVMANFEGGVDRSMNVVKARMVSPERVPPKEYFEATYGKPEKIEKIDYSDLTYKELRQLASERGIDERKKVKIIEALEAQDAS